MLLKANSIFNVCLTIKKQKPANFTEKKGLNNA